MKRIYQSGGVVSYTPFIPNSGTASTTSSSGSTEKQDKITGTLQKEIVDVLKESGITVTLRAPEKPIVLEMNKEDMWKAISMIYDNLEQYAEPDSRVYADIKDGRVVEVGKHQELLDKNGVYAGLYKAQF